MKKTRWQAVEDFFLEPATAHPVAMLRIGVALVLLSQAFLVRGELLDLFSGSGIVQAHIAEILGFPHAPRIAWFVPFFSHLGIDEAGTIYIFGCGYALSLIFFLVGFHTRVASVATFVLHWVLMNTGYTTAYGADMYAHLFLFYLMWVPSGHEYSIDRALGRVDGKPTVAARVGLRVMQLHLSMGYLYSAVEKAQGVQWWNGELMWRALNLPEYRQYDFNWLVNYPLLSKIGGWGTLLVEGGYAFFIWPRATRGLWIVLAVGMHLGIAIFLGLGIFGLMMAVLTPALFAFSAEPRPEPSTHQVPLSAALATPS